MSDEKKLNLLAIDLEPVLQFYGSKNLKGWNDSVLRNVYVDVGKRKAIFEWMMPTYAGHGDSAG